MAREFKDSGIEWIGQIPKEWEIRQFRRIFEIQKIIAGTLGYDVLSVTQSGIKVKDLTKNEGQIAQDYSKYQLVAVDDYVMNHMDLLTGFVDCSKQIGVTSPDYRVFRAISKTQISLSYYLRIFQTCYKEKIFYHLGQGVSGMGRWRLPAEQLKLFYLPTPPLSEQQKIANYLDKVCGEVDEMVALQEKMIEELKAYKQSVITEAVTKGLNPNAPMKDSGIDWIGEIPEHWNVCRIKDLVILQSGTNLTSNDISDKGIYPVYGGNGLRGYYNQYLIEGEYILIGRQGALCGNINYANGKFWPTEHAVVCYPKRIFIIKWLGELLRAMNLGQYSLSSAQPGLAVDRIKNIRMPYPSEAEQQQIASYLDTKCSEIDSLIAIKQQKIEELKEYKKSIIYEYVTGKKEVA